MNKKFGYVTLATTKEYLRGALFLHYSLKAVKSKYPLVVLITEDLKNEKCLKEFDKYKIIKYYQFKKENCYPRFIDTINKFHVFKLFEYNKMVFIDADIYILYNIDFLLDNYNDYEFLCTKYKPYRIDEDFLPLGDLFLFTPNKKSLSQILSQINTVPLKMLDDEIVIKYILYPQYFIEENYNNKVNIFNNLNLPCSLYDCYYHDTGAIKYFNYIKINPKIFSLKSVSKKINFFQNWKTKKKIIQKRLFL